MARGWRDKVWLVVASMLVAGCASTDPGVVVQDASPIDVGSETDGEPVRVDPDVRIVTLSNGLTVYLRENDRPGGSVEMRLAVNAGSGQEDTDQSGVAHFLEHMLFNGTAQFPANELIDTLRGFGMAFGADVNAYTSYDETVYELTVPTTDPANVGTGLDVLREWLAAATIDADQVESEKGVVLDEWRQRDQTLDGRIARAAETLFLNGSEYEGRQPIGSDAAINAMTPDLLRRFYDRWYRPDNAAIMVVGDIDVDEVAGEINERFESLTARGEPTARSEPSLAPFDTAAATVLIDPDATTGDVEVSLPGPYLFDGSIGSLRHDTLISLAFDMITTRLDDDISRGLAPFTDAFPSNEGIVRMLDAPSVMVSGEADRLSESVDVVTAEFERARRFGFDDSELERVLRSYRSELQAEFDSSDTVQDIDYIGRYVDHFLSGQPIPNADTSFQIYDSIYAGVTADAVGSSFNELMGGAAPHVLLVAPDSAGDVPTEADLLARIAQLPDIDITPREVEVDDTATLMTPPEPVVEASSEALEGDDGFIAPTLLTFDNGARVVLNPTTIADNDIYLSATSPGGLSLVADADVPEAQSAVSVVTASGIGDFDPVELDRALSGATIELYPSIDQTSEGFFGSSTTDDLEMLLQLVNLYMTAPRFDSVALDSTIRSLQAYVDDPTTDPDLAEYIAFTDARWGSEPRYQAIPTPEELAGLDLPTIERVWRERFTNPADWVFALSGDFELDEATELARRYFGTLGESTTTETYKDFQIDPPSTVVTKEVHAGTGDKGSLTLDWNTAIPDLETGSVYADMLASVLNIRLTDHIREELGASYGPSAYVTVLTEPDGLIETYLNVTGDPSTLSEISGIVIEDVTSLRTTGPTSSEFDAAVAELVKTYTYFDNQTIGDLLTLVPDSPAALTRFKNRNGVLNSVTADTLQQFIGDVMPLDRYIEIRTTPA
jgi:zinc protease